MTTTKVMITLRLDPEQYNEVVEAAQYNKLSLNEYCLRRLAVSNVKHEVKARGRRPRLKNTINNIGD